MGRMVNRKGNTLKFTTGNEKGSREKYEKLTGVS
jgi:hypothetical protein